MGLVVDGVEEAVKITAANIEAAPDFGAPISSECLRGVAKLRGKVISLLHINRVLSPTGPCGL